ncbi:hypothetical protein, variant [Allomyces macrogynus ATCC 38327]|nr:hypothetical protein, variant [Allomyces macrogynus ATCC 38327]|eukprot:KNE61851.1 hypothetical protein, variant [Allomyces macrogynus ATCC 38327]
MPESVWDALSAVLHDGRAKDAAFVLGLAWWLFAMTVISVGTITTFVRFWAADHATAVARSRQASAAVSASASSYALSNPPPAPAALPTPAAVAARLRHADGAASSDPLLPDRARSRSSSLAAAGGVEERGDCAVWPGVTILRPLKGVDCNLRTNLAASFMQEYPTDKLEIIFCVANAADPAIELVQELMLEHSEFNAKLVVGELMVGENPKINNLIRGYDKATHDIVWICDSNVWVSPPTLRHSIEALTNPAGARRGPWPLCNRHARVGMVHHLPVAEAPTSLGADLEWFFLNAVHAKMYVGLNWLSVSSCIIGKSTLFRRSDLATAGGLRAFGQFMAEDNMMGTALWNRGLAHVMTTDRARQALGTITTRDFYGRRIRWGRIRKYTVLLATVVEPLSESLAMAAIFAMLVRHAAARMHCLWIPSAGTLFAIHTLAWLVVDYLLAKKLVAPAPALPWYRFAATWLAREVTALPLYLWAMAGACVAWRDATYQLLPGGTVRRIGGTAVSGAHPPASPPPATPITNSPTATKDPKLVGMHAPVPSPLVLATATVSPSTPAAPSSPTLQDASSVSPAPSSRRTGSVSSLTSAVASGSDSASSSSGSFSARMRRAPSHRKVDSGVAHDDGGPKAKATGATTKRRARTYVTVLPAGDAATTTTTTTARTRSARATKKDVPLPPSPFSPGLLPDVAADHVVNGGEVGLDLRSVMARTAAPRPAHAVGKTRSAGARTRPSAATRSAAVVVAATAAAGPDLAVDVTARRATVAAVAGV